MATLVLSTAGGIVGGMVGGPLGAVVGRAVGGLVGGLVDSWALSKLAPTPSGSASINTVHQYSREGPRLSDLQVQASTEGAPIPRIYGRVRLAGQIIWATRFEEEVRTTTSTATSTTTSSSSGSISGGKGGGSSRSSSSRSTSTTTTTVTETNYYYYANFAVALCEGEVREIRRIWADGKPLDMDEVQWRFYPGSQTQDPDPLIVSVEGADNTPAYRGLCYVVFERLPLERFGNRIPQLSFEVVRPVSALAELITAVDIIPGAGEFAYEPTVVARTDAPGSAAAENAHARENISNWTLSMRQLRQACPNVAAAALVVSWFGDDLRCGVCTIRPKVEVPAKTTTPYAWKVAGLARSAAHTVSQHEGRPAYGGTPSDASVINAIRDLNARGIRPTFYPFVMMDIPHGNMRPDPYTGNASQPPYPWRGRITCSPAPGRPASPDKSVAVLSQVNAFVGSVRPWHFHLNGDKVVYSGPAEWSYRRFILHYAWLCKAAGNVEAFLIGSELRGLTWLRDDVSSYPFVQALRAIAADVKSILGPSVKVSYAADWSEYFGHHPQDGSGDVHFHLDPLWADANIDFIGIDNYMPLADWRAGMDHLDARAGAASIYDPDYLKSNIAGGEGHDWYYASEADRVAQRRTPITDGAYGKPWVFRYKDLLNWWSNPHHDRPGGVEKATSTSWQPRSKPIWFTEIGCPAVDNGANQPNVFYDPKSSESALPHFSRGRRDDAMQYAYLRAVLEYWRAPGAHNPVSPLYGGPMVEPSRIFCWTWDARPYPWYPTRADIWGDADSHEYGHWLNGRAEALEVSDLVRHICRDWNFHDLDLQLVGGVVSGFVIDRPTSARAVLDALTDAFAADLTESGGVLRLRRRQRRPVARLQPSELIDAGQEQPLFEITRDEAAEQATALALGYTDDLADQRPATVYVRAAASGAVVPATAAPEVTSTSLPATMPQSLAGSLAAVMLAERRAARERLQCALGQRHLALEPGDVIELEVNGQPRRWRITRITDEGPARRLQAVSTHDAAYDAPPWPPRKRHASGATLLPPPEVVVMDVPLLSDGAAAERPWVAAYARPWPGTVSVLRQRAGSWGSETVLGAAAIIGELLDPLPASRPWVYDRHHGVRVRLYGPATLQSVSDEALLAGANACAIGNPATGEFEVLQFRDAELVAPGVWRLSTWLRGQRGSEPEITNHPAASSFVLLNALATQLNGFSLADRGNEVALKAGPSGRALNDRTWRDYSVPFDARGLRPLAPVHLRQQGRPGSDITFRWIRRSRLGGAADAWQAQTVPLGEAQENYRVEIVDAAGTLLRTFNTTMPQAVWTAAQQAADLPIGVPAGLQIRIAQVSGLYGPGAWLQGSILT